MLDLIFSDAIVCFVSLLAVFGLLFLIKALSAVRCANRLNRDTLHEPGLFIEFNSTKTE